ncbi:P-loop NTPase family protein [Bartonella sp. LJL80]
MNASLEQLPLALSHSTNFYPDDLVVTKSNIAAFELIERWPSWSLPVAVLTGPNGAGKTHFARVWVNLSNAFIGNLTDIDTAITKVGEGYSVLLEDVDANPMQDVALFHLINAVKQANTVDPRVTLLLTAQTNPSQWNVELEDLSSRLKSVTLARLEQPDDELLTSVAFKLFADRQIAVDAQTIGFLISRGERSLLALEHLIESIDRLALQRKSKITKTIISEVLQGHDE